MPFYFDPERRSIGKKGLNDVRGLRGARSKLQVTGSALRSLQVYPACVTDLLFICRGEKSFTPTNGDVNNKVRNL